jgi:hypothetical protein
VSAKDRFDDVFVVDPDDGKVLNTRRPATRALEDLWWLVRRATDKGRATPTMVDRATLLVEELPLSEYEAGRRLCLEMEEYVDWEDPGHWRGEEAKTERWEQKRKSERAKRVAETYRELLGMSKRKIAEVTRK